MNLTKFPVLIWVYGFPRVSETFVRDHICALIEAGCDVKIYCHRILEDERLALKGFESFELLSRVVTLGSVKKRLKNKCLALIKSFIYLIKAPRFDIFTYIKHAFKERSLFVNQLILTAYCIEEGFKVIHAHFGPYGMEAAQLKKIGLDIKVVTTFHGYDLRLGIDKPSYYENFIPLVDHVIAISSFNKTALQQIGFQENKMSVIPNGINTDFYSSGGDKNNAPFRIITVARLAEEKALHIAIKSIHNAVIARPDLKITYEIIGEGPLHSELESLIHSLEANDYIKLLGAQSSFQIKNHLANAHVFILSSIKEALPTVLLEAQSMSLGVISTNVGGIKELLINGVLVESGDIEGMTNGILSFIDDQENLESVGKQNRNHVVEKYDRKMVTAQLIALYDGL